MAPMSDDSPLRFRAPAPKLPFHVILIEPEIPPNTGNVARLCAGTGSPLHLVGTLGFRIDEHAVRRAGLDYWHLVDVRRHDSLEDAERVVAQATGRPDRSSFFSRHGGTSYFDVPFEPGDALVFG